MNARLDLSSAVRVAVSQVTDPELHQRLGDLDMVGGIRAGRRGQVTVQVTLTTPGCPMTERLRADVTAAARTVTGVREVAVEFLAMPDRQRSAITVPPRPQSPSARALRAAAVRLRPTRRSLVGVPLGLEPVAR
jgi:ATP-binding protein involved in chromosome partitioning